MSDSDHDKCTCGHEAHQHVADRGPQYSSRCTVCTCDEWDWNVEQEQCFSDDRRYEMWKEGQQ